MKLLVNIDVPDVAKAEAFYTAAFGLTPARRFGPDTVELLGFEAPLYLLRKQAGSVGAGMSARDYTRHWTPVHCDVVVDDLDAALARAPYAAFRRGRARSARKSTPVARESNHHYF